jgi:hypothetical protein
MEEGQVKFDNVTRDDWIVGGLALLLAICLLILPWFDLTVTIGSISLGGTLPATDGPDGWAGILAVLAALAIIADLGVERLSPQTQLPMIGGSRASTRFVLAAIAAGFTALKFVLHIHFSLFGWGFYVSVVVAAALVYAARQVSLGHSVLPSGSAVSARSSRRPSDPPGSPPTAP